MTYLGESLANIPDSPVKTCWNKFETTDPPDSVGKLNQVKEAKTKCLTTFQKCSKKVKEIPKIVVDCFDSNTAATNTSALRSTTRGPTTTTGSTTVGTF